MRRAAFVLAALFYTMGATAMPTVDTMVLNRLEHIISSATTPDELLAGLQKVYGQFGPDGADRWQLEAPAPEAPFLPLVVAKQAASPHSAYRIDVTLRHPDSLLNMTHKANSWHPASVVPGEKDRAAIEYAPTDAHYHCSFVAEAAAGYHQEAIKTMTCLWWPPRARGKA